MSERNTAFVLEESEFFGYMLEKTRIAFQESSTLRKHPDKNWNYAVCDTPIKKGVGVFFGLNWGGDDVDTQSEYPEADKKRDWKFISHSRRYFRKYLNTEIEQLNYSNLCFFRSPEVDKIQPEDWEIAIPLFKEYIDYINPPWTLLLGSANNLDTSHLWDRSPIQVRDVKHDRSVNGCVGCLFGRYPFGSVPHPNSRPMSSEARHEIWQKVTKKLKELDTENIRGK